MNQNITNYPLVAGPESGTVKADGKARSPRFRASPELSRRELRRVVIGMLG